MKRIKLTESQLNRVIKRCVKKALNESTTNQYVMQKWDEAIETNGAYPILDEIYEYLDCDVLADFIKHLQQDGFFDENDEDGEEYDEYDEDAEY